MTQDHVCPYFHSESGCDVGEDYISPHDVETIVGFCNGRYPDCMTYRMIKEHGMNTVKDVSARRLPEEIPVDVSLTPLSRSVIALFGLSLGLCLAISNTLVAAVTTVALMVGGLVLMVHGVHDWRQEKAFAATINCAYGLFGVSLIPLLIMPRIGMSSMPDPWGTTSYLAMWGLFSIAIYITAFEYDRWLGSVFGLLTAAILTLAVSTAIASSGLAQSAGGLFSASGLIALLPLVSQRRPLPALVAGKRNDPA